MLEKQSTWTIYGLVNTDAQLFYVGQTKQALGVRFSKHLHERTDMVPQSFVRLASCDSQAEADREEREQIATWNYLTNDSLFNVLEGGPYLTEQARKNHLAAVNQPGMKANRSEASKRMWADPVKREAILATRNSLNAKALLAESNKHPDRIARRRATSLHIWSNPEKAAEIIEAMNRHDVKIRMRDRALIVQNLPGARAKNSAQQKIAQNQPEVRARNSAAQKIAQNRSDVIEKNSAAQKIRWADPVKRTQIIAAQKIANNLPEAKARRSESTRRRQAARTPEQRSESALRGCATRAQRAKERAALTLA